MTNREFDRHEDHVMISPFRKMAYGLGNFGSSISENLVMNFVMIFYPVILKLNPAVVGVALLWPRLWDAVADPLMGQISDRTRSRWGRRRPYILFGAPLFGLVTFFMFAPPASLSDHGLMLYISILAFVYYTTYSIVIVPYTALGAELSIDYHERTRVQAWRSVLMFCANFLTAATWWLTRQPVFPNERVGSMVVVGVFSVLCVCGLWACFAGTREEKEIQGQTGVPLFRSLALTFSNRGFVVLGLAYALLIIGLWGGFGLSNYVTIYYVLGGVNNDMAAKLQMVAGLIMTPASMAGCVFWAWIGTHIGKRNGLLASLFTIAAIAPFSWFLFTPTMPYLQLVMSGLLGFCFGALTVFPNSMVADLCDLDEVQSFARREGAYNGIIAFVVKVGFSGTFFMTGALLKLSGFNEKIDVQAPEAMTRIRILMAVIPVLVMAMAAILLIFYPLNEKRVHEIRDILEKRRAERLSEKAEGMELSTT